MWTQGKLYELTSKYIDNKNTRKNQHLQKLQVPSYTVSDFGMWEHVILPSNILFCIISHTKKGAFTVIGFF